MQISSTRLSKKILPRLRALHKECFPAVSKYEEFPFPRDQVFVIQDEKKKYVGMGLLHKSSPEDHFSRDHKIQEYPYLYNFCIHKNLRRKNLGTLLMKKILEKNKNINLVVDKSDVGVIKFYLNCGFRIVGTYFSEIDYVCMTSHKI